MAAEHVVFSRDLTRVTGTLLILLAWAMSANAQLPPAPEPDYRTIDSWKEGGAIYRRPGERSWDEATLESSSRPDLPAFVLRGLSSMDLDTLTPPKVPFQIRITDREAGKEPQWLTEAHLRSLSRFENFQQLSLSWSCVDESAPLRGFGLLKNVRHLDVITTTRDPKVWIRPELLSPIADLPDVSSLHVVTLQFDKGTEWIGRMKSLRSLELSGCIVTNASMASLGELENLEELSVRGLLILARDTKDGELPLGLLNANVIREALRVNGLDPTLLPPSGDEAAITRGLLLLNKTDPALLPPAFTEIGPGLKRLRTLKLAGIDLNESAMAGIARLPALQVLELSLACVTDEGLANLAGMPELQTLNLSRTAITGSRFPTLPRVTRLDLSQSQVTDKGLEDFDHLPELRSLDLSRTKATLTGLRHAEQLSQLGSLNLSESAVSVDGLKNVGRLTALRSLDLSKTKTSSQGLKALASLKGLQHLNLSGTNLARAIPVALAELESLETLDLSQTMQTGAGLGTLIPLKRLHTLNLSDTRIDRHGFEQLARLTSLTSLDLSRTFAADRHIETLTALSGLENLTLCGTRVTDEVLPFLGRFPRLTTVDLTGCAVAPAALAAFRMAHPRIEVRDAESPR